MKSKKILLGSLSAMALVATPIAAVVSCDNDKTAEAVKASIVKATADDYKLTYNNKDYFVSKDDAAKAGSFVVGAETFTWDKALSDKTVKFKNDADKKDAAVTTVKATPGDFGLKLASGENKYFDATGLKAELKEILKLESDVTAKLGITLKFDDNKKLAADSLTKLNNFLESAALEVKGVTHDDAGNITSTLGAVSTTGTGTNTGGNGTGTKVSTETSITKSKSTGFLITMAGETFFVTADQAKAGASVVVLVELDPLKLTWDKKLEVGKKASFKAFFKGKLADKQQFLHVIPEITPKQADDQHFVLTQKGATIGYYKTLEKVKQGFGTFVSEYDGIPINGVKLLFDKTTNAVTTEGIKIFNDLLKATGLVVKSATVRIVPAVPASSGSGPSQSGSPSEKWVSIVWDTTKKDNADITAVKGLFTTAAITGANTTAVTAVTTASTTALTAMPTIAGVTWTHAFPTALNGVKVTVKSIAAVAATSGATGNIVLELTKGTGTAQTVTIAITHA